MIMTEGCIEEKLYDNRPLCIQSEHAAVVNDSARQALQPTREKSNSHPPISRVNKSTECSQHVMLADAITQRVSERGVRNYRVTIAFQDGLSGCFLGGIHEKNNSNH